MKDLQEMLYKFGQQKVDDDSETLIKELEEFELVEKFVDFLDRNAGDTII